MEKIARFTRSDLNEGNKSRCFWPLVKCVTVRVPNKDLLKHVTLVDLPGKGDRNKSRDQMWKKIIDSCSTLWIVTNMNRAVADRDAWDILKNACDLVESGGICQNIHFICTKTDEDVDERPASEVQQYIRERNASAKKLVNKNIEKFVNLKKHLRVDCFTVSSREFSKPKYMQQNETEIPQLREVLEMLNMFQGQTFSYVNKAREILSLMEEARGENLAEQRKNLCAEIIEILKEKISNIRTSMNRAYTILDKCLTKGAENSRCFCQGSLHKIIHNESGSAFHSTLKCVVENRGIHRSKQGELIDLNSTLSSFLTKSINEDFRKIFPNDGKSGDFYGVIHNFSLVTGLLMQKYKTLELQLRFLKAEEDKLKVRLIKIVRNRKKMIYSSLTQTVEETMQECYKQAAAFSGKGSLDKMRLTIENYIDDVKDTIFVHAKEAMLNQLKQLMEEVVRILSETFQKSVELSLREDDNSIPDISNEFEEVMKHYNELMSTEGDADLLL
uniref:Nuclear GTPase SLIP-GC-like n=1 Tax=Neogobius melanostomus TaxID=47308 RepID=A0A8C6TL55_9GOBI